MKLIFLFIDGVGIGEKDKNLNPIYNSRLHVLADLIDSARFHADASLGVDGLPQSATGQTAIFTGVNAPKALNRHMSGQPTITLKKIIHKVNIFSELKSLGLKVTSANVYRDEYLNNMLDIKNRRNRPSVTSVMSMASGNKFRTVAEYLKNNGVYHDITGEKLKEFGYEINTVSPEKAAVNLHRLSREYDFTLFEYFMTDIAGHKAGLEEATQIINIIDSFLKELIGLMDFNTDVLILTSDHGNIEDIESQTHTMNKVPVIVLGNKAESFIDKNKIQINSLVDIMPFVVALFKDQIGQVNETNDGQKLEK